MTESSKKKPRKRSISPTQLALAECRRRGWDAEVVEKTLPRCFIKKDLFGVIDVVAMANGTLLALQVTSGPHHANRKDKALAEPRLKRWLLCGGRFAIWSYTLRGMKGRRKLWTLREEYITLQTLGLVEVMLNVLPGPPSSGSLPAAPQPTAACPETSSGPAAPSPTSEARRPPVSDSGC